MRQTLKIEFDTLCKQDKMCYLLSDPAITRKSVKACCDLCTGRESYCITSLYLTEHFKESEG